MTILLGNQFLCFFLWMFLNLKIVVRDAATIDVIPGSSAGNEEFKEIQGTDSITVYDRDLIAGDIKKLGLAILLNSSMAIITKELIIGTITTTNLGTVINSFVGNGKETLGLEREVLQQSQQL